MREFLPFDIMCEIFSHYQREEDDFHPLETLLLVCKSWASAALSDRALWGRYKIRLGHEPTMRMWRTRLPLRLMRSGDSHIEIDISIDVKGDSDARRNAKFYKTECLGAIGHGRPFWVCRCDRGHESMVTWVFDLLTGPNGRGCERWRVLRFYANIYFMDFGPLSASRSLFRALAYPMPSLVSLSLHRISPSRSPSHDWTLVSCAPMLSHATFGDCCLPQHLNWLKNARRIEISNARPWGGNLVDLSRAEKVEQLVLDNVEVTLPNELPHLSHLTLTGWRVIATFKPGSMPRLTCLSLDPGDRQLWQNLTSFQFLPLEQLKHLEIRSRSPRHPTMTCKQLEDSIFKVILSSGNLSSIAAAPAFFSAMFKWLSHSRYIPGWSEVEDWDPRHRKERVKLLSSSGTLIGELSGEENPVQLSSLALKWGLPYWLDCLNKLCCIE